MAVNILAGPVGESLAASFKSLADSHALIAAAKASEIQKIDDWYIFEQLVQRGAIKAMCPVGYQITDGWAALSDSALLTAVWDVVHHYDNGDVALKWHYADPNAVPFDEPEAIYYAPTGGLAAGTYHIPIGSSWGTGWDTSKAIQFTIQNALAAGAQIFIDCGKDNKNDPTNGRTGYVYASGSATTATETFTTSNGTSGTSLGTIGATNIHKPEGNLNGISRVVYGYGRWSQSAKRQYYNSIAGVGAWWTPQNPWDRPSSVHTTVRGFLAGCSEDFLGILRPVPVVTALNTAEGFTDATETTYDKIFLPSLTQMNVSPQYAEDEKWDYYVELARQAGYSNTFPTGQAIDVMKTYSLANPTSAVYVFLRSAYRSNAYNAWYVSTSGYVGSYSAFSATRGCPACIIRKSA